LVSEKKNFIGAGFCILGKTITSEENTENMLRNVYPVVINFSHFLLKIKKTWDYLVFYRVLFMVTAAMLVGLVLYIAVKS
jgi:hypothetical protein